MTAYRLFTVNLLQGLRHCEIKTESFSFLQRISRTPIPEWNLSLIFIVGLNQLPLNFHEARINPFRTEQNFKIDGHFLSTVLLRKLRDLYNMTEIYQ